VIQAQFARVVALRDELAGCETVAARKCVEESLRAAYAAWARTATANLASPVD